MKRLARRNWWSAPFFRQDGELSRPVRKPEALKVALDLDSKAEALLVTAAG
jgi:hypothetical protein